MVMFNSYVKLPEGNRIGCTWDFMPHGLDLLKFNVLHADVNIMGSSCFWAHGKHLGFFFGKLESGWW